MDLKELQTERAAIVRSLNEMSDRVAEEARSFTPDEMAEFDKLSGQQSKILDEINTLERVARAKTLVASKSEIVTRDNGLPSGRDFDLAFRGWALRQGGGRPTDEMKRAADRVGQDIYGEDFTIRDQSTSVAEGGYTTSSKIYQGIVDSRKAYGGMASLVTNLNTSTGEVLRFATQNDTSVTGSWGTELTDIDNDALTFGEKTLSAYLNVSGVFPVSLQLVQDSHIDVESYIGDKLGKRLARNLADGIVNGGGTTEPTGIVTSATSNHTTATSLTELEMTDIIQLYVGLNSAYRSNATWLMSSGTHGELLQLVDGNDRPLLQPSQNYNDAPFGTLFGKRIVVDDACPATAAGLKPIFFGDFSAYMLRRAGGTTIAVDRSLYFRKMALAFVAYERVDGLLLDTASVRCVTMKA